MRAPEYERRRLSGVAKLMIALTVCWVLQAIDWAYLRTGIQNHLVLSLQDVLQGSLWQLITYQFLHGPLLHLLCNLLAIWCFGRAVADSLGMVRMLKVFFLSGVAGGVLHLIFAALMEEWSGPVVGASAGTSGLLAAFCLLTPGGQVYLWGVLPIRASYLLYFALGLSIFLTLVPVDLGVAHTAHLGGLLAGMAMIRWGVPEFSWLSRFRRSHPQASRRPAATREAEALASASGDFISREIDPILEKISHQGIHSLTEKERKTLEAARQRMRR